MDQYVEKINIKSLNQKLSFIWKIQEGKKKQFIEQRTFIDFKHMNIFLVWLYLSNGIPKETDYDDYLMY